MGTGLPIPAKRTQVWESLLMSALVPSDPCWVTYQSA